MVVRFPMVCDSCSHRADGFTCDAFPERIPLNPMNADLHDEPLPDQGNNIVWQQAPGQRAQWAREDFDAFRAAVALAAGAFWSR